MRNKMVNLSAKSIWHFYPEAEIHCLTLYKTSRKEYSSQEPLDPRIKQFKEKTKYTSKNTVYDGPWGTTSGYASPLNGLFFMEGYNFIQKKFSEYDGKLLILTEDHFFTSGKVLKELLENDWDAAYADAFSKTPADANAAILGINPFKLKGLFPLPEVQEMVEPLLGKSLLLRVPKLYRIKHRNWIDYCGDGIYTNSSDEMKSEMIKAGIPV